MTAREVLVVDPGNYTPYYDLNLCHALLERGWAAEWWTSPYLFEPIAAPPHVPVKHLFLRTPSALIRRQPWIGRVSALRRALKALHYPIDLWRLDRTLRARRPGILHVQWALLPALDARYWRRWQAMGWRIVYTAHDVDGLDGTTPRSLRRASRRLYRLADAVAVHSEFDHDRVVAAGVTPARVHRVAQGTPGIFSTGEIDRTRARQELGLDPERPTILLFGLLKAYKGLPMLLTSLAEVRTRLPDVLLLIVGETLVGERETRRTIEALDLGTHVRRVAGYVPTDRVGLYFAAADVVALPYRAASSSAVLVNAFSHGRPVVATRVGALPEMVEDGITGHLVPSESPAALAEALANLLGRPGEAEAMGRRARERAASHHAWSLIARQTEAIYATLDD